MTAISNRTRSVKYNQAYNRFIGGQNTTAAPDNLVDVELQSAVNVDLISRGAVRVRAGAEEVTWECMSYFAVDVAVDIQRIIEFATYDGTIINLVLANGVLLRRDSATPIATGITTSLDYTIYANKLYMLYNDSYWVYSEGRASGTLEPTGVFTLAEVTNSQSDSMLASVKKCKYITVRNDRIFCSGNPDGQNALYFSQIGDPTYFKSGGHVVNAESSDGDRITGIEVFNNALVVFKANSIWAWTGSDPTSDVSFERLNAHTGTRHHKTIQLVNSHLFFLGIDGVYIVKTTYSGTLITEKVSSAIDNIFEKIHFSNDMPDTNTAVGEYHRGKYYLSFCDEGHPNYNAETNTKNNTVVVCHVSAGEDGYDSANIMPWTVYTGVDFNDLLASGDDKLYFAGVNGKMFIFSDDAYYDFATVPIEFEILTKDYDMGSPVHIKKFKRAWVWVNQDKIDSTVFNFVVKVDYASTETTDMEIEEGLVYGNDDWGNNWGWIDTVTRAVSLSKKGIRASIKIYGDSTMAEKNRLYLYGVGFMYKIKKPYK